MLFSSIRRRRFMLGVLAAPAAGLLRGRAAAARETVVYDAAQLRQALAGAGPGDHVVLAGGVYEGSFAAAGVGGTPGNPVVVRAAAPLGATVRGFIKLAAPHVWLTDLFLEGAKVELAADGARMSRCRQVDTAGIAVLLSRGVGVEIDRNELSGMRGRGISVRPNPRNPRDLLAPRIHRNRLRDFVGAKGENVHEVVQLGQTESHTDYRLGAVLEMNLIERIAVDPEVVSIKSSDNLVRMNTLLDCDGVIDNRHGERNEISANWLERTRGLMLRDRGGRALGNRVGSGIGRIYVMAGDVSAADWPAGGDAPAADGWLLAGNVADRTVVGHALAGATEPALGTRLEAHAGLVVHRKQLGATSGPEASVPIPAARRLEAAEVGPGAP